MLNTNSQTQDGGDGTTMLQARQINYTVVGIDEKRAREIIDEKLEVIKREILTKEALETASIRNSRFEQALMPLLTALDPKLKMFADPAFQVQLIDAQKTAISTEREADYDMLAELLKRRVEKGEDRETRAGIRQAVNIVGDISDEALLGLTVAHSLGYFTPVSGDIYQGLDALNNLFGKLLHSSLPLGGSWLDHSDALGALRIIPFGGMNKVQDIVAKMLGGYVALGIKKDSGNYFKSVDLLRGVNLNTNILVENHFNPEYLRLNVVDKNAIQELKLVVNPFTTVPLTSPQYDALRSVYDLYENNSELQSINNNKFMAEWDTRPNLKTLREWWDNLSVGFNITSVGKVLAHANAKRIDNSLPDLG